MKTTEEVIKQHPMLYKAANLCSQLITRASFKANVLCEALASNNIHEAFKLNASTIIDAEEGNGSVLDYRFDLSFNLEEHLDCITRYFLVEGITGVLCSYKEKFDQCGIFDAEVINVTNPDAVKEAIVTIKFLIKLR